MLAWHQGIRDPYTGHFLISRDLLTLHEEHHMVDVGEGACDGRADEGVHSGHAGQGLGSCCHGEWSTLKLGLLCGCLPENPSPRCREAGNAAEHIEDRRREHDYVPARRYAIRDLQWCEIGRRCTARSETPSDRRAVIRELSHRIGSQAPGMDPPVSTPRQHPDGGPKKSALPSFVLE